MPRVLAPSATGNFARNFRAFTTKSFACQLFKTNCQFYKTNNPITNVGVELLDKLPPTQPFMPAFTKVCSEKDPPVRPAAGVACKSGLTNFDQDECFVATKRSWARNAALITARVWEWGVGELHCIGWVKQPARTTPSTFNAHYFLTCEAHCMCDISTIHVWQRRIKCVTETQYTCDKSTLNV